MSVCLYVCAPVCLYASMPVCMCVCREDGQPRCRICEELRDVGGPTTDPKCKQEAESAKTEERWRAAARAEGRAKTEEAEAKRRLRKDAPEADNPHALDSDEDQEKSGSGTDKEEEEEEEEEEGVKWSARHLPRAFGVERHPAEVNDSRFAYPMHLQRVLCDGCGQHHVGRRMGSFVPGARGMDLRKLAVLWNNGAIDAKWFCTPCWKDFLEFDTVQETQKRIGIAPARYLRFPGRVSDERFCGTKGKRICD